MNPTPEVNTGAAFSLPQFATGVGFMTERFSEFLEACDREAGAEKRKKGRSLVIRLPGR